MIQKFCFVKFLFAVMFISFQTLSAKAQHLVASTEIEKNVAGLEYRGCLSLEGRRRFSIGTFYQFGLQQSNIETKRARPYYGLQVQFPIVASEKIFIAGNMRAGFVNKDFLLFVPSIITTVRLSSVLSLSFGSGLRMQNAAFTGGLNLTI